MPSQSLLEVARGQSSQKTEEEVQEAVYALVLGEVARLAQESNLRVQANGEGGKEEGRKRNRKKRRRKKEKEKNGRRRGEEV